MKIYSETLMNEILHVLKAIAIALAFFIIFVIIFAVKRKLHPSPIIFYEGISIITLMTLLFSGCWLALQLTAWRFKAYFDHNIILGILLGCLVSFIFHILIPLTLERSISVTMLSMLRAHEESLSQLQCNVVEKWIVQGKAIESRVYEQLGTGDVIFNNDTGKIKITDRGIDLTSLWVTLAKFFSIKMDWVDAKPLEKCHNVK